MLGIAIVLLLAPAAFVSAVTVTSGARRASRRATSMNSFVNWRPRFVYSVSTRKSNSLKMLSLMGLT